MDFFFWLFGFLKKNEALIIVETTNFFLCCTQKFGSDMPVD